jgi:antitoxin CptB
LPELSLERKPLPYIPETTQIMAPETAAGEDLPMRRRRLRYRAWHRGTKEMDLVLGPFCDAHLPLYGTPELDRLETLMDEEDTDLLKWVMGQEPVPPDTDAALLHTIIAYRLKTAR